MNEEILLTEKLLHEVQKTKTEIYTSAQKTASPYSKKTSYQAKLKQKQTKILNSTLSHITLNQLHDYSYCE